MRPDVTALSIADYKIRWSFGRLDVGYFETQTLVNISIF